MPLPRCRFAESLTDTGFWGIIPVGGIPKTPGTLAVACFLRHGQEEDFRFLKGTRFSRTVFRSGDALVRQCGIFFKDIYI